VARPERETVFAPEEARLEICQIVGRLMELWGFRKNLGRIWALLYVSDGPLSAGEIAESLAMSRGSASMALQELLRWGVVRKSWKPGERKDFFAAEEDVAKVALRVLRERELPAIDEALGGLRRVLAGLERGLPEGSDRALHRRTEDLMALTETGRSLLRGFVGEEEGGPSLWSVFAGRREERR
jgi:DNA-binding transcriptional regulator GbsR (MarR family)